MTDEHLMRHWAEAHSTFSDDFDRGLARLRHFLSGLLTRRRPIGRAYAPAGGETSAAAQAALAGALACLATMGVLFTLSLLFAADISTHAAAGAPIVAHAIVA